MFGRKVEKIETTEEIRNVELVAAPPVFIELQGALCEKEDDRLIYTPRGEIAINPARIAGYYDHTIMIDGYKIRVMESYAQIALKIVEAYK